MVKQEFDAETVVRSDGVTAHELSAFPSVEEMEYDGNRTRAYRDRAASVAALFERAVDEAPDRTFAEFPDRDASFTYAEFAERVERIAAGLEARGLTGGGRVGFALSNRPAFLELLFACVRLGAIVCPINTYLAAPEIEPLVADAELDLLVTGETAAEAVCAAAEATNGTGDGGSAPTVVRLDESPDALAGSAPADAPVPSDERTAAAILFTSGTTGRPKGCRIDNFHLCNAALNNARSFGFPDGTRSLVTTPLFHVAGLVSGTLSVLTVAGSVVIRDGFSPATFLRTIEEYDVTYVMGVPTNYILAVEKADPSAYDLSSLEVAAYGSAPMPSEAVSRIREAFPDAALANTYGKTETTSGLASMCPDRYTAERTDSVGLPTPLLEHRVVADDGTSVKPGEVGELAVRGGIVVSEYVNRPEATAAEFDDGWHYTGDLAVVDEEGFVTLKGRDSDVIIRGGKNVYALEVEEALAAHPDVLETSVAGFPDEVLGQRVLAAVVPKPDVRLTEDDLRRHCADRLAEYKRPEVYRVLDELPRNPNGKVQKEELLPEPLAFGISAGD